jgi:hypothetical protein
MDGLGGCGAAQELRRLGRAGSAWLEPIRPDQVRHGGAALKSARWVNVVGRGGSAAWILLMLSSRPCTVWCVVCNHREDIIEPPPPPLPSTLPLLFLILCQSVVCDL